MRPVILVHGGGAAITKALSGEARFEGGRRVTDGETARLAAEVLLGIGREIQERAATFGFEMVHLHADPPSGIGLRLLDPRRLGNVGVPSEIADGTLIQALARRAPVVVSPCGRLQDGSWLNVNGDDMASGLAALFAVPVYFFTDVEGVRVRGRVERELTRPACEALIRSGMIQGGMVAKVEAALGALEAGAPEAWIGRMGDGPSSFGLEVDGGTRLYLDAPPLRPAG